MPDRLPPKEMAKKIARLLKKQDPDYGYLKKVFAQVRESLGLKGKITRVLSKPAKRMPMIAIDDACKESLRSNSYREAGEFRKAVASHRGPDRVPLTVTHILEGQPIDERGERA